MSTATTTVTTAGSTTVGTTAATTGPPSASTDIRARLNWNEGVQQDYDLYLFVNGNQVRTALSGVAKKYVECYVSPLFAPTTSAWLETSRRTSAPVPWAPAAESFSCPRPGDAGCAGRNGNPDRRLQHRRRRRRIHDRPRRCVEHPVRGYLIAKTRIHHTKSLVRRWLARQGHRQAPGAPGVATKRNKLPGSSCLFGLGACSPVELTMAT